MVMVKRALLLFFLVGFTMISAASVAGAQTDQLPYVDDDTEEVPEFEDEVLDDDIEVLNSEVGAQPEVLSASSSLPVTGLEIAGLATIGVVLVGFGSAAVAANRRHRTTLD